MLQQVCEHIHNYFITAAHRGQFVIDADGMIPLPFLKDGQRFLIAGSDLNDGVYTFHPSGIKDDDDKTAAGLQAEMWTGTICAMAVPPPVIALAGEITQWVDKYDSAESPYQSENVIGVYSYTKATGGSGAGGSITWQDVYKSQLDRWRKLCF